MRAFKYPTKHVIDNLKVVMAMLLLQNTAYAQTICGGAGEIIGPNQGTTVVPVVSFNAADVAYILDVNASVNISHTYVGDLRIILQSPAGTSVKLIDRPGVAADDSTGAPYGCALNDINALFDDESPNPPAENDCAGGTPVLSGSYKPHATPAGNALGNFDTQNPVGNWNFIVSDNADSDAGTVNQVCLTIAYAGVLFDKWVSTQATCSDRLDTLSVPSGTGVYYCYIVTNVGTEPFVINAGNATDNQGLNISGLQGNYAAGASQTVVVGPLATGGAQLPIGTTVNTATIRITGNSANFPASVTLNTSEVASLTVTPPDLSTSTKSVIDLNGGDIMPGDRLRYSITIIESGSVAINNVSVTDTINVPLLNFVVTNAGGGTDSSTPGTGPLNITNLSIPANGAVTVQFEVDVAGSATQGTLINNTAVINNPVAGVNTNAVAPTLVVAGATIPGAGTKRLYFRNVLGTENVPTLPQAMSRVALTAPSAPPRLRIQRQDTPVRWDLTPALQAPLGLSAAVIPVVLQMQRDGDNNSRNLRVTLDYAGTATGFLGCLDLVFPAGSLSNTVTNTYTFNVQRTNAACTAIAQTPITLPAGTVLRATLDNQVGGATTGRAIFVYPFDAAVGTSRVELPATTVINVDSVNAYSNVAYPGGVIKPAYSINETVRARAVVSDPFGHADIFGATLQILDTNSVSIVPAGTAMTEVAPLASPPAPYSSTKTFEYIYNAIPNAGPLGNWTMRVIATEGTDPPPFVKITDLGVGVFKVVAPLISMIKLTSTLSDPLNNTSNPKAIPGAIVEYQITVQNMGEGAADNNSIIITEPLPPGMQLFLGNPANPLQFANGTPTSGLTYTFTNLASTTDDIEFSNNGGATFITPVVDAQGFDITAPPVNVIRILPKGAFSGNNGSGNPNFTIRFKMRVL